MAAEMLDPRTAIGEKSIWSPVGEVQFQRNVSTLWKATRGRPKEPQTYLVAVQGVHNDGVLPIALELQLVNGMASIAAAKKGVEWVSAAVIEIPRDPSSGLRFSLAANEGISQTVKDCLDEVIASVRRVAREEWTAIQCKDEILNLLVQLHRPRINARLQPKKSRRPFQEGLEDILSSLAKKFKSPQHDMLMTRLEILRDALRQYANRIEKNGTTEDIRRVVLACYDFCKPQPDGGSMKAMLGDAGIDIDESRGNPHLRQVGKIATLCHISELLSSIASHPSLRYLCVNLSVRYLPAYRSVPLLVPSADGGSSACRVHAEVQLVVELDVGDSSGWNRPRVIGSSKAPCYLCELFINQHGQYLVPRTHGKLTPRWTIPDLNCFSESHVSQYRSIVMAMNCDLKKPVAAPPVGRLDPAMSWQALSQLNFTLSQPIAASHADLVTSRVQTSLPSPRAPAILDGGQPLAALSLPDLCEGNSPEQLLRKPIVKAKLVPSGSQPEEVASLFTRTSRLSENAWPTTSATSHSPSSLRSCHNERHLHAQQCLQQTRSSMSLGFKQSTQAARIIRDHESRVCDMLFECNMNTQASMQHSNNMSRRIDFHDRKLFLEIEHPMTDQIVIRRCSRPEQPEPYPVIDVDRLTPGLPFKVDAGQLLSDYRMTFLTKKDAGVRQWWACIWKKQHGTVKVREDY